MAAQAIALAAIEGHLLAFGGAGLRPGRIYRQRQPIEHASKRQEGRRLFEEGSVKARFPLIAIRLGI